MLKVNTQPFMKEAINTFIHYHNNESIREDKLSEEDWEVLEKVSKLLSLLEQLTLELEGHSKHINGVLPVMHLILEYYEEWKSTYSEDPILISMINTGWRKMDKYYNLTDSSPAYIAGVILDPNLKWQYLEEHWILKEIKGAKKVLKEYWNKYYKPQGIYLFIPLEYLFIFLY